MKIGTGSIAMESTRSYSEKSSTLYASYMGRKGTQIQLDTSSDKSLFEQMTESNRAITLEEQKAALEAGSLINRPTYNGSGMRTITSVQELKARVLEHMVSSLESRGMIRSGTKDRLSRILSGEKLIPGPISPEITASVSNAVVDNSGRYILQRVQSEFYSETEVTAFQTKGTVTTEDGRELSINFSFEMSRRFEQSMEIYTESEVILCDPLVLNFKGDVTELSDQKFLFDMDCDGVQEEISHFDSKSGFLTLDLNDDGRINDGSELFGTQSGNGFADLAAYDYDGNGWIDENDEIFDKLKVWTKDSDGKDVLMTIKKSGVGAIYLGTVNTRFSLNNLTDNVTNGVIRESGIFLMESGEVNTIQHVDFAV